jgi:hypothetical protein
MPCVIVYSTWETWQDLFTIYGKTQGITTTWCPTRPVHSLQIDLDKNQLNMKTLLFG